MGVPSLYKLGVILLLLIVSCSEEPNSPIESRGVGLDTSNCFVDAVSIDSLSFASGAKQWLLDGLIVCDGIEYPYSMMYGENPMKSGAEPVSITPPNCIRNDDAMKVHLTREGKNIMISWRTPDQFLCVKTVLTSAR